MGRVVIDGEVPIKVRPATQRKKRGGDEEDGRSNKQKELFGVLLSELFVWCLCEELFAQRVLFCCL
eukprot:m.215889 g.215889  ORF g.215889 m.215889 type:complete len:66 (+) comp13800_c0_seq54:1730-1927(+)